MLYKYSRCWLHEQRNLIERLFAARLSSREISAARLLVFVFVLSPLMHGFPSITRF